MSKLINHIRAHRKRLGFTQADLAFLINRESSHVSRNERRLSEPTLRSLIRYSIILQVSIEDLFPGVVDLELIHINERLVEKLSQRPEKTNAEAVPEVWKSFETLKATLTRLANEEV